MAQGKFITLYGINNIGKSTQARLLVEKLKQAGYDALYLKYPLYNLAPTGPKLNEILRTEKKQSLSEEELQTLFQQNRLDFEPELKRLLDEGKIIVAEDYTGTGIAWGRAKGLQADWIEKLNKDLLKEDLAILLRGKRYIQAREQQHLHEQNDELVQKVDRILLELAEAKGWKIVEVQDGIEQVAEKVWEIVFSFLQKI